MDTTVAAFKRKFKTVKGLDKIFEVDPDFHFWGRLYKIQFLQLVKDYDYVEWKDITNLNILFSTPDETLFVDLLFTNISCFHLSEIEGISGFEIEPNDDFAFGNERLFIISDYEDARIGFCCQQIEVRHASKEACPPSEAAR